MEETWELAVVSGNEFKIKLWDEAVETVSTAVTESIGPSSIALGDYVAHKIKYLHWKSAVKTLAKVKKIADENGGFENVPNPKMFLPWMEGVSLEHPEDELMHERWANLLANSMNDEYLYGITYTKILSELSGRATALLEKIASEAIEIKEGKRTAWFHSDISTTLSKAIAGAVASFFEDKYYAESTTRDDLEKIVLGAQKIAEPFKKEAAKTGTIVIFLEVSRLPIIQDWRAEKFENVDFSVLDRLGLIEIIRFSGDSVSGRSFSACSAQLTSLGFEFYKAVSKKSLRKAKSQKND